MAMGPVPSVATFLATVTKPSCFSGLEGGDATILAVLGQCTDTLVSALGDRATPPILEWGADGYSDNSCVVHIIALAARQLIGYRGYKKDSAADSEYIELAKRADDWLELVATKRRHPTFKDSTQGYRPDTPRISYATRSDAWTFRDRRYYR
jgi:hypothetical protein